MEHKVQKTFDDTLSMALRTDITQEFRLCVDEKNNMSIAKGRLFPVCPSNTKRILDIVIRPAILK